MTFALPSQVGAASPFARYPYVSTVRSTPSTINWPRAATDTEVPLVTTTCIHATKGSDPTPNSRFPRRASGVQSTYADKPAV